jgi:hypothetical protein
MPIVVTSWNNLLVEREYGIIPIGLDRVYLKNDNRPHGQRDAHNDKNAYAPPKIVSDRTLHQYTRFLRSDTNRVWPDAFA